MRDFSKMTLKEVLDFQISATEEEMAAYGAYHERMRQAEERHKLQLTIRKMVPGKYPDTTLDDWEETAKRKDEILTYCRWCYPPEVLREKYRTGAEFDDWEGEAWKAQMHNKTQLLLTGSAGTGKTVVTRMIQCELLRGYRLRLAVVYKGAEDLYQEYRSEGGAHNGQRYTQCDVLIIDDHGQGGITDVYKKWLHLVIDRRWEQGLPTIVTTNLNSEQLREAIGDALLSRLSSGQVWKFEGEDYRFRNRQVISKK